MARKHDEELTAVGVPQGCRVICRRRQHALAVGAEDGRVYCITVARKHVEELAMAGIPQAGGVVC
jgi:hypothetical protein